MGNCQSNTTKPNREKKETTLDSELAHKNINEQNKKDTSEENNSSKLKNFLKEQNENKNAIQIKKMRNNQSTSTSLQKTNSIM